MRTKHSHRGGTHRSIIKSTKTCSNQKKPLGWIRRFLAASNTRYRLGRAARLGRKQESDPGSTGRVTLENFCHGLTTRDRVKGEKTRP